MAKKSPERIKREQEEHKLRELEREIRHCPEPTYFFEEGEVIKVGLLKNTKVLRRLYDGKAYEVEYDHNETDQYGRKTGEIVRSKGYWCWYKLRPEPPETESLIQNSDVRMSFICTGIGNILSKAYYFGLDLDPEYQRGFVWSNEDKVRLIDSIFRNIDIGKFALVRKDWNEKYLYEVLDGKQRIRAILDFYENKFPYKGKYFNDLCARDQNHFEDYMISMAEIDETDQKTILKYFLMLNTGGVQMDKEHLEKVQKQYDNL